MMALGATRCSIFGSMTCAHEKGPVGRRWSFFFPFSLFYHALENLANPLKKMTFRL